MIGRLQMIGAVVGASTIFVAGWQFGHGRGENSVKGIYEKREAVITAEAREMIQVCRAERDQARGEVDKINRANEVIAEEKARLLAEDERLRRAARNDRSEVAKYAADTHAAAAELVQRAQEILTNAQNQCARVDVDPDLLGVLNELANPSAIFRDGGVSGDAPSD